MTASPSQPPPTALPTEAAGRLIVCERSDQWAAALRRELADAGVRLWETNNLPDCWQALAAAPAAMLIVELSADNAAALVRRMAALARDFPYARIAVVAPRSLARHQWLMREMGAVHFVSSPRRLGPLAELALRHLAALPSPQQTLPERIWASLPWGKAE